MKKEKYMRINRELYHDRKCRFCKYLSNERGLRGFRCICPEKILKNDQPLYRLPSDCACAYMMRYRDDPMVVYIAGPMSGIPGFNRKAFSNAERMLRNLGFRPINPAMLPTDLPEEAYMPICFAMLEQCEAIYCLQGWEQSKGALMEMSKAMELGLKKLEAPDLIPPERKHGDEPEDAQEG